VQKILPFVVSPAKDVSEVGVLREQSLSSVDSKMESITSNDSDEKVPGKKDGVMQNSVKVAAQDTPLVKPEGDLEGKEQGNFNFIGK
jgi:hypothetical protein